VRDSQGPVGGRRPEGEASEHADVSMVADRGALASALDSGTHARAESSGLIRQRSEEHDDASQTPVVRSFTYVDPVENHRPVRAEDLPLIPSESVVLVDTSGDVDRAPGKRSRNPEIRSSIASRPWNLPRGSTSSALSVRAASSRRRRSWSSGSFQARS